MTDATTRKKKLIEVALPLDEINAACKAEKNRKTGTIRNVHKWFAPMPLPAWRALLFAALVDDPQDDNRRVYLLDLVKRLVENGADLPDTNTIQEARSVLQAQFPDGLPTVMDPFCGGGSTLVEAQRLGLRSIGSDLNPVPALISRTITELLPKVWGHLPIHQLSDEAGEGDQLFASDHVVESSGYEGVRSDLRYYADVVRTRANQRLSHLFPPQHHDSAWIWARTAACPNPACGVETILTTTWWLSKRKGSLAWLQPVAEDGEVHLRLQQGKASGVAPTPPKIGRGAAFSCVACDATLDEKWLIRLGERREIGLRLMAILSEDHEGNREFRLPGPADLVAAELASEPDSPPSLPLPDNNARWFSGPRFGFTTQADLYTPRQLQVLSTFADEVASIASDIHADGGSSELVEAITSLLGLALGKLAHGGSTQNRWKFDSRSGSASPEGAFGRADLPMNWDFVEVNPLTRGAKSWHQSVETLLEALPYLPTGEGKVTRSDARVFSPGIKGLVATDPPYFDAIGYADLSDYFYVWHRLALRSIHPDLYGTIATPKTGELTAVPSHHGGKDAARRYFIDGFTETFQNLQLSMADDLPLLVVYASKEQKGGSDEQTRWSSILAAMLDANLEITGTWPIHGTGSTRMIGQGANAVATYIVMVCHPRDNHAPTSSLADFNRSLRRELGPAIRDLQAASILPVDLAQAAMGPGMQIFSRYRAVLDQSGHPVQVEQALRLINSALSEVLEEQEGDLDRESRFAVRWWETYGWLSAPFGEADKAARPLGIGVDDVVRAQVARNQATRVQLLGSGDLDRTWTPSNDVAPTAWEAVHHLCDRLIDGGGELEAAKLMSHLGPLQDPAMALTYRLHDIAAKKGRTADQERYNALINSWAELVRLSGDSAATMEGLF